MRRSAVPAAASALPSAAESATERENALLKLLMQQGAEARQREAALQAQLDASREREMERLRADNARLLQQQQMQAAAAAAHSHVRQGPAPAAAAVYLSQRSPPAILAASRQWAPAAALSVARSSQDQFAHLPGFVPLLDQPPPLEHAADDAIMDSAFDIGDNDAQGSAGSRSADASQPRSGTPQQASRKRKSYGTAAPGRVGQRELSKTWEVKRRKSSAKKKPASPPTPPPPSPPPAARAKKGHSSSAKPKKDSAKAKKPEKADEDEEEEQRPPRREQPSRRPAVAASPARPAAANAANRPTRPAAAAAAKALAKPSAAKPPAPKPSAAKLSASKPPAAKPPAAAPPAVKASAAKQYGGCHKSVSDPRFQGNSLYVMFAEHYELLTQVKDGKRVLCALGDMPAGAQCAARVFGKSSKNAKDRYGDSREQKARFFVDGCWTFAQCLEEFERRRSNPEVKSELKPEPKKAVGAKPRRASPASKKLRFPKAVLPNKPIEFELSHDVFQPTSDDDEAPAAAALAAPAAPAAAAAANRAAPSFSRLAGMLADGEPCIVCEEKASQGGGRVLLCNQCSHLYHFSCARPTSDPPEWWKCGVCLRTTNLDSLRDRLAGRTPNRRRRKSQAQAEEGEEKQADDDVAPAMEVDETMEDTQLNAGADDANDEDAGAESSFEADAASDSDHSASSASSAHDSDSAVSPLVHRRRSTRTSRPVRPVRVVPHAQPPPRRSSRAPVSYLEPASDMDEEAAEAGRSREESEASASEEEAEAEGEAEPEIKQEEAWDNDYQRD